MYCQKCGKEIPEGAISCANCGKIKNNALEENKEQFKAQNEKKYLKSIIGIIAVIFFIGIAIVSGCNEVSSGNFNQYIPQSSSQGNNSSFEEDKRTFGEIMALSSAKNYLRTMGFSREGLIRQLEFEGYSTSEATYAVDNCGANWMEQAVRVAKRYLSVMAFSKQGLIQQLEFEGFTCEEAEYGVEQAYK